MAPSPPVPGLPPARGQDEASAFDPVQHLWGDPVLRIAFLASGLLLAYQLAVTLLQPAWIGTATDWLQVLITWSGLLMLVHLCRWFMRTGHRVTCSAWWTSAGFFFYALASTLWLMEDQFLFPNHVPIPFWHNLFFILQYPCYLLALLLMPRVRPRIHQALVALDCLLLLGAGFALSWYFLLAPIYESSQETLASKVVNLIYPVGDLALFFGVTIIWLHYREYAWDRAVLGLLIAAIGCLVIADSWFALLLLRTSSYQSGRPPDLFWMAFYLLLPLAGLVRFRFAQRTLAGEGTRRIRVPPHSLRQQDLLAGLQVTAPVAAAWLASTVLFIRAELIASTLHPLVPDVIALGLLALALVRQYLTAVENERLRREREAALRENKAQMETFLGIAGHELKNPLGSLRLGLQMIERRIRRLLQRTQVEITDVAPLLEPVMQAEHQEERLERLVSDLLDIARIQAGKLDLRLAPTDLTIIVREAIEEQQQVHPERTLVLECSEALRAPVMADAQRIGQVVTNFLTNALKYSPADRFVAIGLQVDDQQARLWVRDQGLGIPPEEQAHIWDRFHRVQGIEIQNGSGAELGLGLHISQTIIEQHHGQVGVQSARGTGSTFWFSLPLAPQEPALEGREAAAPEG